MLNLNVDDLVLLLGYKEAELFALRREHEALRQSCAQGNLSPEAARMISEGGPVVSDGNVRDV